MSRCDYCKKYNDCKDMGAAFPCGAYVPAREYVIVCNEHPGIFPGTLLFWGHRTKDHESRSFGGYSSNIKECEVYTREEVEKWRGSLKEQYPFFDEIDAEDFHKKNEVVMTMDQLKALGFRSYTVMFR